MTVLQGVLDSPDFGRLAFWRAAEESEKTTTRGAQAASTGGHRGLPAHNAGLSAAGGQGQVLCVA